MRKILALILIILFSTSSASARRYKLRSKMPAKPAQKMGPAKIKESKVSKMVDRAADKFGSNVMTNIIGGPAGFAIGAANKIYKANE